jgi:glycosyltransferase involved in cell wall biosynthesis
MMEPARRTIPEFSVLEMGEVSAEGVAEAFDNLYRDPHRRQQLAQAAYQAAQNPDYTWDAIAARFDELFAELAQG